MLNDSGLIFTFYPSETIANCVQYSNVSFFIQLYRVIMFKIRFALAAVVCFSAGLHAEVSCSNIHQLDLSKNKVVKFNGSLLNTKKCWYLPVKSGQRLQITLDNNSGDSAITVYKPGATIQYGSGNPQDEDPANYYHGDTIQAAPAYGKARRVDEVVHGSGDYLMVVELTLGASAEFKGSASVQ